MSLEELVIRRPARGEFYNFARMHIRSWKMCYANSIAADKLKEFDVLGFVGEYHRLIDEDDRTILIAEDSAVDRMAAGRIGTRQPQ